MRSMHTLLAAKLASTLLGLLIHGLAFAQAEPQAPAQPASAAGSSTPSTPDDKTNFKSDRIKFPVAIPVRKQGKVEGGNATALTWACAPAFTTFKGVGTRQVENEVHPEFKVTYVPKEGTQACGSPLVAVDDTVLVSPKTISGTPPDRFGLTYGVLFVPYKRQIKGEGELYSKASVGGFLGYRQEKSGWGLGLQYVVFGGVAPIEVTQAVDGKQTSQTLMGLSYGFGVLGMVKGEFPVGLVLGFDRVNKSAGYRYNDRPWIALSFGY